MAAWSSSAWPIGCAGTSRPWPTSTPSAPTPTGRWHPSPFRHFAKQVDGHDVMFDEPAELARLLQTLA